MTLTTPDRQAARTALISRELHAGWTARSAAGPVPVEIAGIAVPAEVPGAVHLDLLRAGLIPDPYLDDNESLLSWIGLSDWTYQTAFAIDDEELAAERQELVFDGLDTVATILLDGDVIAEVANQHRVHRIDVTGRLGAGEHTLTVAFRSPVRYANAQSLVLGARPRPYPLPYEAIRKSACSFGWDWGINTATSGIWRGVRLESWSGARMAELRLKAEPQNDGGRVTATVRVERASAADVVLALNIEGTEARVAIPAGEAEGSAVLELDAVERWWPAGHGEQPLHEVSVLLEENGTVRDTAERRVGFRTLRWDTAPDADGTPFRLLVNERPVYVKGVNWIPDDAFFARVDRARYARRLEQAKAANVNLIRVWGGGIYESDDFFDLCDELGLLTWQDFLFACAAYPEEEPLRSQVEAEARDNILRIGHHASLALLTGNNENLWGYEDWDWKRRLDGRSWGAYYYHELFPRLVEELAPQVPYAPGSPFSPGDRHPNDESHGTMHLWEQWNRQDWLTYREHHPRFVAEFGWQGPPAWSTLTRWIHDEPLTPESPGMIVHQKAMEGNDKLVGGLVPHYRVPEGMREWHWAMQLNQANAVSCALDWFRSCAPLNSGAVVWQLNDCWPVTSWAAIDGDGREKPLFFALKNSFAPRVVSVQPHDDGLVAVLGNDTAEPLIGELLLTRRAFDGAVLAERSVHVEVPAWGTLRVPAEASVAVPEDSAAELLVVEIAGVRGFWWFAEPRDSVLPAARLSAEVRSVNGAVEVTMYAHTLVRDLTLLVDALDPSATVDSGLVTLLPGESHTFRVEGVTGLSAETVLSGDVARSGNQLVTR